MVPGKVIDTVMSMLTAGLGMALPMVLMELNIPCVGGALLVGIYLRYLAANRRYLVLLIRGDF